MLSGNVDAVVDVVKALEPNRRDLNRAMAAVRLTKSYSGWLAGAVERGRGQVRVRTGTSGGNFPASSSSATLK